MQLSDLTGERYLSGLDTDIKKATQPYYEDANVIYFIIDGVTYGAVEDPSDGYRSNLEELEISDYPVKNTFPPQKVIGVMAENSQYGINDYIIFTDAVTGKVVLEVGTDNVDDYYPSCILNWYPENLAINIGK